MAIKFEYYDEDEFKEYLDGLSDKEAAKLIGLIKNIEIRGLLEAQKMRWVSKLENNLYEVRCHVGGKFPRLLFFRFREEIDENNNVRYIVTNAFSKKSNKTPEIEKKKARQRRSLFIEKNSNK